MKKILFMSYSILPNDTDISDKLRKCESCKQELEEFEEGYCDECRRKIWLLM